jgi:NAD(P)-dependent dehydrogenase (short-subunit alcohol dehydrogenase family)
MAQGRTVAVVTGASRGLGRGIAIALGSHGCTVYVTGRTVKPGDHRLAGTVAETAAAVTAAGGEGVAVQCDHADDAQTKALIERVVAEQGRIDILVNNACYLHDTITEPGVFWEKPIQVANIFDVGLKSGYVASYYAAPTLVAQKHGLIVFTGSQGGVCYMLGPAYGAHKAGEDKFAADMGVELKEHNVAVVNIWAGGVRTERMMEVVNSDPEKYKGALDAAETPEFTGHVIWGLYTDPNLMELTAQSHIGAELAVKYGVTEEDGRQPRSMRDMYKVAPRVQPWPKYR